MSYIFILLNIIQLNTVFAFYDFFFSLFIGLSTVMFFVQTIKNRSKHKELIENIEYIFLAIMNPLTYIFLFSNFLMLLAFGIFFPKLYYFAHNFIGTVFFIKILCILFIQMYLASQIISERQKALNLKLMLFLFIINIISVINKTSFDIAFTRIHELFININGFIIPKNHNIINILINTDTVIKTLSSLSLSTLFSFTFMCFFLIIKIIKNNNKNSEKKSNINTHKLSVFFSSLLIVLFSVHIILSYAFGLNLKNRNAKYLQSITGIEQTNNNSKKIQFSLFKINKKSDDFEKVESNKEIVNNPIQTHDFVDKYRFIIFRLSILLGLYIILICCVIIYKCIKKTINVNIIKKLSINIIFGITFYKALLLLCSESSSIHMNIKNIINIKESINIIIRQRMVLTSFFIFIGIVFLQIILFISKIKNISLNNKK